MVVKKGFVVLGVATGLMLSVQSQILANEINSYDDYRLYCSPGAYQYNVASPHCSRYDGIYKERLQGESNQYQNRRRRTVQEKKEDPDKRKRSFIGGTFGTYFPDLDGANTGIGGTIVGGTKFNKNLGIESEFGYLGGGTDIDGVDYNAWAFFISPRFMLPLTEKENPSYLYLSPGIGASRASADVGNITIEDSTRFTWQTKLGVSLPINKRYSSFAQVRYASQTASNTVDFFSSEVGFAFEY